jgi:hypothetical protein
MVSLFKVFRSNYLKGERIFLRRDMKALAMLPDLVEDFCSQAEAQKIAEKRETKVRFSLQFV